MILYTPLPIEQVMEGHDHPMSPPVEMTIEGKQVLIEPLSADRGRIIRLLSTDPADFLETRFLPGSPVVFTAAVAESPDLLQ